MVKIEFIFSSAKDWSEHYNSVVAYITTKLGQVTNADDNERWSEPERHEWGGCTYSNASYGVASQFVNQANQLADVPGSAKLIVHRVRG